MIRGPVAEAIDRAYARAVYEGRALGAEVVADCIDGAPVFRAPNRAVARRLKRAGYRYSTWLCREPFGGGPQYWVRGWH
jgi:hypothetical protein